MAVSRLSGVKFLELVIKQAAFIYFRIKNRPVAKWNQLKE